MKKKFYINTHVISIMVLIVFFSIFYIPILFVLINSFNIGYADTSLKNFSFHWYEILFQNRNILHSIITSLCIAASSASMAVFLGIIASLVMFRFKNSFLSGFFSFVFSTSLIVPDIITGFSFLLLFLTIINMFEWIGYQGALIIWICHTTFCISYVIVIIKRKLYEKNSFLITLEEAAMDLGATPLKSFIFIKLPIFFPSLTAAWFLSFSLSLDDVVISSFVTRPGTITLPMQIFAMVRRGVSPEINAIATLLLCFFIISGLIIWKFISIKEKKYSFKEPKD